MDGKLTHRSPGRRSGRVLTDRIERARAPVGFQAINGPINVDDDEPRTVARLLAGHSPSHPRWNRAPFAQRDANGRANR